MIDTHCHLTFPQLFDQLDPVLARAADAGVDRMITVGTTVEDSQRAAGIADRYRPVYATAGIHPHYADRVADERQAAQTLRQLLEQPKVVAIGEMGLDRHYPEPSIDAQKRLFEWQLGLAQESTQPIVIHNREATHEVLAMIRASGIPGRRFVFHCFTGTAAELDVILAIGAMVSFTGVVTFRNSRALADCLHAVPLERMMIETDAPYLTPEPHRKQRPNQPCYVADVAGFIARELEIGGAEFVKAVDDNAARFFGLTPEP